MLVVVLKLRWLVNASGLTALASSACWDFSLECKFHSGNSGKLCVRTPSFALILITLFNSFWVVIMAVLDEFEAQIVVDGGVVREFDDDEEMGNHQPNTVTKYVEATSQAKFGFRTKISAAYEFQEEDSISIHIHLDGTDIGGRILRKERFEHGRDYVHSVAGSWAGLPGNQQFWGFYFADLETRKWI